MAHAVHALDKAGQAAKRGDKKKTPQPAAPAATEHRAVKADPDFSKMKVADLLVYAAEKNVKIPDDALKADIVGILTKLEK